MFFLEVLLSVVPVLPTPGNEAVTAVSSRVLTVGSTGAQYRTIQAAVNAASDGDIILVAAGTYSPVRVEGKALTITADTFVPGVGGPHGSGTQAFCGTLPFNGIQVHALGGATWQQLQGQGRRFRLTSPVREFNSPQLTYTGSSGDACRYYYSDKTRFFFFAPVLGTVLIKSPPLMTALPFATIGPSGSVTAPLFQVGDLGLGVEGIVRHVQGYVVTTMNEVILADHQVLVLLDSQF